MKNIKISQSSEYKCRKFFISDHSKFIHTSWLLKEDLDKIVVIDNQEWKIVGLWDLILFRRDILLKNKNDQYAIEDAQVIANALGYHKMRNLLTGEENKEQFCVPSSKQPTIVEDQEIKDIDENPDSKESDENKKDEFVHDVWTLRDKELVPEDLENEEEDEYVDPLILALRNDVSDDENT